MFMKPQLHFCIYYFIQHMQVNCEVKGKQIVQCAHSAEPVLRWSKASRSVVASLSESEWGSVCCCISVSEWGGHSSALCKDIIS